MMVVLVYFTVCLLRLREHEWSLQLTMADGEPFGGVKVTLALQTNTSPVSEMTGQVGMSWVVVPRSVSWSEKSERTSE